MKLLIVWKRVFAFFLVSIIISHFPCNIYSDNSAAITQEEKTEHTALMETDYYTLTDGHVRFYSDFNCSPLEVYSSSGHTAPTVTGLINGSDFIPIHEHDLINIVCGWTEDSYDIREGEFYLYFYDNEKRITWDYLDYTNEKTGEKNRLTVKKLKDLNGFQFAGIPEGTYLRVAKANGYNCHILIWDGEPFGYPLTGLTSVFNATTKIEKLPTISAASIQIPSSAICLIAKPGYTFINMVTSNSETSNTVSYAEFRFPSQVLYLRGFYGAERHKNVSIVKGYDYTTGKYSSLMLNEELTEYVVAIDTYYYSSNQNIKTINHLASDTINSCMDFIWKAEKDIVSHNGKTYFHQGNIFHGIPYRSAWTTASNVGWHVTKQTFMNAANDPDSIFYHNPSTAKPGPYYSLVCSSFATLASGFAYPMTIFSMMKDPMVLRKQLIEPVVGSLMTNGYGHCFIPTNNSTEPAGKAVLTLAEQIGPLTAIRNVFEDVSTSWKGIGLNTAYPNQYIYQCTPQEPQEVPYDITSYTIKNGSARPHRGDQSVYTSEMDVLINIKNPNANRLYYQKFNFTCKHGVPFTFSEDGDPLYIPLEPGTAQINLRSATDKNDTFSGVILESGAIYGVWAAKDEEQQSAPTNTEFFEWYDISKEIVHYNVTEGTLITNDVFWYATTTASNQTDYIREDKKGGIYTIPYQNPVIGKNGLPLEHSDYSNYAECAQLASANSVFSFFRKGQFGAYVTGKEIINTNTENPLS